jgi:hypothetical protein
MRRRKYLVGTLVAAFALTAMTAAPAFAAKTQTAKLNKVVPSKLPKKKRKNVALNIVTTTADPAAPDQVPSPAVRALVNFDNEFLFRPGVAGRCTTGQISGQDTANARSTCRSALVGGGAAVVFVPTGTGVHITYNAEISAFNGPPNAGRPTIILFSYVGALNYGQPLNGVLKRSRAGRDFGKALDVTIPPLPFGAALTRFDVTVGNPNSGRPGRRGYVKAKCGDRNRKLNLKARFTYQDGTSLPASNAKRCKRKRR